MREYDTSCSHEVERIPASGQLDLGKVTQAFDCITRCAVEHTLADPGGRGN